jgi:YVTN family beta-propeller protein
MVRSTRIIAALPVVLWVSGIAFADHPTDAVSVDGDPPPQRITWQHPVAVDMRAFPSAGEFTPRVTSEYLTVNDDPEGDMPRNVAFLADGSAAVMVNRDTDNVTFFDVATQTVTDAVGVEDFPVHVAVTPNNQYIVTANVFANSVSIIDVATRTLLAHVPITGAEPFRVAVTPDSNFAVVGVINDAVNSSFSIVDLSAQSEVLTFDSTPQGAIGWFITPEPSIWGNIFTQFALSPDGTKIVLPDRGNAQVAIYDRATGAELALLPTPTGPTAVDISSDSTLAVVSHETSPGMLTTIDLTTLSVVNSFSTSDALQSQIVRLTPDKTHALAAISNNTIFTNLTTGARTATLYTGVVGDIELSFDGQYAFVSNYNSRVIDIASRSLVKTMTFAACAEAATSPVEYRAVALNNRFRENIHLYNINGGAGFFEGFALSGPLPEGDAPRDMAISADGRVAIACNNVSRNVSIVDMTTRTVRSYVDVGDRPLDAAFTPDGAYAVVCATDENCVRVIDLSTDTVVASLFIYDRPARVRISPDGQYAYVLNISGSSDRISFIRLDGPASTIETQLSAGQTGSMYVFISGIELSHDGATLAVCDSFNDRLRLYDTATQTQLASVPIGDFPLRVTFTADDAYAYVGNTNSDDISVVAIDGPSSYLVTTIGSVDYPLTLDSDADGAYVYVCNFSGTPAVRAIDTSSNTVVQTVPFPDGSPVAAYVSWTDGKLYAVTNSGALTRFAAAGPGTALVDTMELSGGPWHMAFDNIMGTAVVGQPVIHGIDLVQYGCTGDLDADRDIDLSDLAELLANYGTTGGASYPDGDLNDDGDVDLSDLAELLSVYGTTCD